MKTRHLILPREICAERCNILQMKIRTSGILSKLPDLPLFADCGKAEVESLLGELHGKFREYDASEIIVGECDKATSIFVVVGGSALAYGAAFSDGTRHLVQRLHAGEAFGVMLPMLGMDTYPGMLVAGEKCEVLLLDVKAVEAALRRGAHPRLVANLYALASRQGFQTWRKLSLLSRYEIADRVKLYRKWREEDGLAKSTPLNCSELAQYLGVNRTALYRVLDKIR